MSCENKESESDPLKLAGKWKLSDIAYNEPPECIVFEYRTCVNNQPYGVTEGIYHALNGIINQPDSLTEFYDNREFWTFYNGDSMIINRDGFESFQCWCENNDVVCMQTWGFPVFDFHCRWELMDSILYVSTVNKGTKTFKIIYTSPDSLVLETVGGRLMFNAYQNEGV
jgi:hypothetical protein